jgi:hypothetical protein
VQHSHVAFFEVFRNVHRGLGIEGLYEAPAPIAGPCHEGLAPAPILSHASAVILLGGKSMVNFFQRAELPGVMAPESHRLVPAA